MISKLLLGLFLFTCLLGGCQCPKNPFEPDVSSSGSNPGSGSGPYIPKVVYSANYDDLASGSIPSSSPENWTYSNAATAGGFWAIGPAQGSQYPAHSMPNSMQVQMSVSSGVGGAYSKSFALNTAKDTKLDLYIQTQSAAGLGIYLVSNGLQEAGFKFQDNMPNDTFQTSSGVTIGTLVFDTVSNCVMAHLTLIWHPSTNKVDYYFQGSLARTETVSTNVDLVSGTHLSLYTTGPGNWTSYFDDLVVTN